MEEKPYRYEKKHYRDEKKEVGYEKKHHRYEQENHRYEKQRNSSTSSDESSCFADSGLERRGRKHSTCSIGEQNQRRKQSVESKPTFGQLLVPIAPPSLKLVIMNAAGAHSEKGSSEKRRKCIQEFVLHENPHLVMFQEFGWVGITGKTWEKSPLPAKYQYTGNKQGSIMYDINELVVEEFSGSALQAPLDALKRKTGIQNDFTPIPRMCIRKVKTKGVPHMQFMCVSWHGEHAKKKKDDKKQDFCDLQAYLIELSKRNGNMDLVVGGDFNISMSDIKSLVNENLALHHYVPTVRRSGAVIDFYLTSASVNLKDVKALELVKATGDLNSLNLLDHDPIEATLTNQAVPSMANALSAGATSSLTLK